MRRLLLSSLLGIGLFAAPASGVIQISNTVEKNHDLASVVLVGKITNVAFNAEKVPERVERVAKIFGVAGKELPKAIADLRKKLELPSGLRSEGVSEADLDKLADLAFEDACHRCNPRPCTRDDLRKLYEQSL